MVAGKLEEITAKPGVPPVWYSDFGSLPMRWLILCLLVSLATLLFAAAAITVHILLKHRELRRRSLENIGLAIDPVEESDLEPKL
jgi:hypothetical protein